MWLREAILNKGKRRQSSSIYPNYLDTFLMLPVIEGHSMKEVRWEWNLADLYAYHLIRKYDNMHEKRMMEKSRRDNGVN